MDTPKNNEQVNEQVKPLFEDMGNTHIHDEKSYQDMLKQNK